MPLSLIKHGVYILHVVSLWLSVEEDRKASISPSWDYKPNAVLYNSEDRIIDKFEKSI